MEKCVNVYRVEARNPSTWRETRNWQGVFTSSMDTRHHTGDEFYPSDMWGPYQEGGAIMRAINGPDQHAYRFAFTTLKQYRRVFGPKHRANMAKDPNYRLVRIKVPACHVVKGREQCIYKHAHVIKGTPLRPDHRDTP